MRRSAAILAGLLAALVVAGYVAGCAADGPALTRVAPDSRAPASQDATGQARATLDRLFVAWSSKDASAAEASLVEARRGADWGFQDVDRVEFGPITDSPDDVPGYMAYGVGSAGGVKSEYVRAFRATITFHYKPDSQGVMQDGVPAGYMWFVERQPSGDWLVTDWGY